MEISWILDCSIYFPDKEQEAWKIKEKDDSRLSSNGLDSQGFLFPGEECENQLSSLLEAPESRDRAEKA